MEKLESILPPCRAGRPSKTIDHNKLESLVEVLPRSPIEALESLLIFDARSLERDTQKELLRILPQLIHVRRAWKAHYLEYGCISCPKADERVAIAARMRLKGFKWCNILEIVVPKIRTRREQKCFQGAVRWKLEHRRTRERDPNAYAFGGLCNACQSRIMARMRKRYRKLMTGRDLAEEIATFKDALCLRSNAAQRLFNGED